MVGKDHSVKLLLHFAQLHFIPYISSDTCLCQADFIQYISNSNYWDGHIETAQWWFGGWFGDAKNRVKSFVLRSKVNTQILQLMLSWEMIWQTQSRHLEHEITLFLHQVLSFFISFQFQLSHYMRITGISRRSLLLTSRYLPLHWRHNDHDGVSNHQPHDCLLNRLFRRRSKKTSKLRVTGLKIR